MKRPKLVTATQAEIDEILAVAKKTLPAEHYQLLDRELGTFVVMQQSLCDGRMSLGQIRQAVVAARTEGKREALEERGAKPAERQDQDAPAQPAALRSPTSA